MAEDATMMIGYSLVNKWLNDQLTQFFPNEVDEKGQPTMNIAKEVLSGGASMLFMSLMMDVIRREEQFISWLFTAGETVIGILWARNKVNVQNIFNMMTGKRAKGIKAKTLFKHATETNDNQNTFVTQVQQGMQTIMQGRSQGHDVANTISASASEQQLALSRESQNMKFADRNNQAFQNSIMIKTITGTFTINDRLILQKIIGRSNFSQVPLNVDELNQVREFMIVKDSNGKFVGLTEAFTSLVNGLGFLKH
jgi:hypothetical protein